MRRLGPRADPSAVTAARGRTGYDRTFFDVAIPNGVRIDIAVTGGRPPTGPATTGPTNQGPGAVPSQQPGFNPRGGVASRRRSISWRRSSNDLKTGTPGTTSPRFEPRWWRSPPEACRPKGQKDRSFD